MPSDAASSAYDFDAKTIDGETLPLSSFAGQVAVIVNTASKCGFTPQYEGLENLYQDYKDQGFTVLGFPSNQFNNQEPGDEAEIANFCSLNYDVTFPMFAKIDVNGADADPLWRFIKKQKPGFAGTTAVKWNFTKFLVGRDGVVRRRFAPQETPRIMRRSIEKLLAEDT